MRLIQSNIKKEDTELALSVKNSILSGKFVIGNPAIALKQTLKKLEDERDAPTQNETDWKLRDSQLDTHIALTKAGIEGETELANYISKLLKLEKDFFGIVAFASLSYGENFKKDYTPDTDMLLVLGRNILIIDAKKLKTKPNEELYLENNSILNQKGKELIQFNSSTHFWINIFKKANVPLQSIISFVCIVNDTVVNIVKDENWEEANTKLIHISELKALLKQWVKSRKSEEIYLDVLTEIAKGQVREEKTGSIDLTGLKRVLGV